MTEASTIAEYARALAAANEQRLDPVVRHFDDGVQKSVSEERQALIHRGRQLDDALRSVRVRCLEAHELKPLLQEMRKLRVRGLQFFLFLRTSHRRLKTITRRLAAQVRIDGYNAEKIMLDIELSMSETDSGLFEFDELFRNNEIRRTQKHEELSRVNELNLFLRACLLPLKARRNRRPHEIIARNYARAIAGLIASSTRAISKQQYYSLAVVLWRVVQPTIVPLLAGFSAAYLIHLALELAGIEFLHPSIWVFLALAIAYTGEKAFEHFFEHWHLTRYRKKCADTAVALYLLEIQARAGLIGPPCNGSRSRELPR
jgi:hypothetical protein